MAQYFGSAPAIKVTVDGKEQFLLEGDCKRVGKFFDFLTKNPKIDSADAPAWQKFFEFVTDREVDLSDGKDYFLETAKFFQFDDFDDFYKKHGTTLVLFSDYETYREKELPKYTEIEEPKTPEFKIPSVPKKLLSKIAHSGRVKINR